MTKKTILIALLAVLALAACGVKATAVEYESSPDIGLRSERVPGYGGAPVEQPAAVYDEANKAEGEIGAVQDRMIIKNVDLSIVVPDPEKKLTDIGLLAERYGGHVVSSSLYQTYNTPNGEPAPEAYISIRVEAKKLETAVAEIKGDVVEVRTETQSSQDVTSEYVDLESRLKALEASAVKLNEIMQNATKTEDVLAVFHELQAINTEIETVKGQMKYYSESASYSLINVTIIAEETVQPLKIGPWTPQGSVNNAIQTLIKFLEGFVEFLVWLVLFILPMLIVIFGPVALVVWLIIFLVRRKKAKKAKSQ